MRSAAFSRIAACIVAVSCGLAPITSRAQSCKCPRNPGLGGGVQCSKDQIAICDPSSGECNCTCDSVQPGKTKADYEAQIFSKVLNSKIDPADLSSPQNRIFVSSFRKSRDAKGTFSFDKEEGPAGRQESQGRVKVGVPEWLEEVLSSKGGVSVGPGASLQNCPNGICIGGENKGTATVNNYAPPRRVVSPIQRETISRVLLATPEKHKPLLLINGGDETQAYALQLAPIFQSSKWPLLGDGAMTSNFVPAGNELELRVYPGNASAMDDAKVIQEAFSQAGIKVPIVEDKRMIAEPDKVHILVFPITH
jgi:hypothetical protein